MNTADWIPRNRWHLRPLFAYAVTILAVALAVAVRILLDPYLGDHVPFATFFVAVIVSGWVGGFRPALLATLLGFVCAAFYFVPPRFTFIAPTGHHLVGLGMYFVVSLAIAAFAHERQQRLTDAERLISIVDYSQDAIISQSLEGTIQSWNAAAERLFGYSAEQAIGQHISFLIPAEQAAEEVEIVRRLRMGEPIEQYDTVRLRRNIAT